MEGDVTKDEKELFACIQQCEGYEVHESWWPEAESLTKQGLITLGGARGPHGQWKRAELTK